MRKSLLLLMAIVLTFTLAACGGSKNTPSNTTGDKGNNASQGASGDQNKPTETKQLEGSILAVGSSALQPLVEQASKKFMEKSEYSKITVLVQGGGSGTGLTQVAEGQSDIGNSDIFAEEKFKDADASKAEALVDHQVGVVAMAAVVNPAVGLDNLTKQQLVDIFTGKVQNWKEIGGADQKIVLVNRPASSGTRKTFEKYALGQSTEDLPGAIQEESSGNVKKLIAETPGAIGYLALSYLDQSVTAVKYEGVEAIEDNVVDGKYPVWAYQHMYTKGEPNEVVKAFLDYMTSPEVQDNDVVELGYIPASKMKISRDVNGTVTQK
ncbi:phosphate ABC transporter substrate-binding protein PstS family protein [Paenibacillus sp. GCM10012307]|uniref:Phosphate-binding protein n=1 Tax=Paenibacillus roseus TaxID=2798579 RepID=A0A934J8Z8_9BACL|nr:phosphate ABC transporter substrate-binding protein PstS family protein [Paenibacillus roseus]MBJ6363783.1 phosphate ABC transporter substrate-binding protein PstS family protein [Paenibacillus roseus]